MPPALIKSINHLLMLITYNQLTESQQAFTDHKIAIRILVCEKRIKTLLHKINPKIKIVDKEVILMYDTWMQIEREVKM